MNPSGRHDLEQEIRAIMETRRELGPEYADILTDKIMRMVDEEVEARTGARLEQQRGAVRDEPGWERHPYRHRRRSGITRILLISIPLMAIAGHSAHVPGVLAVLGLDAVVIWISHSGDKS